MRLHPAALLPALLLPVAAAAQPEPVNLISLVNLATSTATQPPLNGRSELLVGSDGNFYITSYGGGVGYGAVARITPAGELTTLHAFAGGEEGAQPYGGLVQASDGNFYGTTYLTSYLADDKSLGTVFRVSPTGEFAVLHSFGSKRKDARLPYTGLVQAGDGNLYGTTLQGGAADRGVVFRISLSGDYAVVHEFTGDEGENPEGTLVVGPDGALYGTTMQGGSGNSGTVYRITTGGQLTTLYAFPPRGAFNAEGIFTNDTGASPRAGLFPGADGSFYGTAYQGGSGGYGTVYRITPAGELTVLHHFTGGMTGGAFPLGGVVQDAAGNSYGTTWQGGPLNRGVAWQIAPDGQFTLLHSFVGSTYDGYTPYAGLTLLNDTLYGITYTDSVTNRGAVFQFDRGTGVLPVRFSVTPTAITIGDSATLSWDTTGAATCTTAGSWTDTVAVSGTLAVTPDSAGVYSYLLDCTDGAGVVRHAYANLLVQAPPRSPVDGGGDGGSGSLGAGTLLLLGGLLHALRRRTMHAT